MGQGLGEVAQMVVGEGVHLLGIEPNRAGELEEIAKHKMKDLNANDIEGAVKQLAGSARSMGLEVVE